MSTTALPPNLSPAYQPRSFRGASPYPVPSASSSSKAPRSASAQRMEHPLPSRPATPLPTLNGPARLNAEPISGVVASGLPGSSGRHLPPSPHVGAYDERRGRSSGLRNEVKRSALAGSGESSRRASDTKEEGEVVEVPAEIKRAAKHVLDLLRKLPAPLPEFLPTTYMPERAKKPSPAEGSFTEYVRSQRSNPSSAASSSSSPRSKIHPLGESQSSLGKRPRSSSPSASESRTANQSVGLGLGLDMPPIPKKVKSSDNIGSAAMTPSASMPLNGNNKDRGPRSPELLRTASTGNVHGGRSLTPTRENYRPRAGSGTKGSPPSNGDSKATWNRARWAEAAAVNRATILKRHGDAHLGLPSTKPEYRHLPKDQLRGLLTLTDSVLVWLYSYWADEQAAGRVKGTPYIQSQALRDFVRNKWEGHMRSCEHEREREMARGMLGLMYLMEAVINHQLAHETVIALGTHGAHLASAGSSSSAASASMNRAGNGSTQAGTSLGANGTGPSPSSTNDGSPPNSLTGPSPHSSSSAHYPEVSAEVANMMTQASRQSTWSSQHLLNARHYLPLSCLRRWFPATYDVAIHSELSDEALPAPNDTIGAARKVDIDHLEHFIWPIELGMCAPLAHLSVFGRRLVSEFAMAMGKKWEVRLGA